MKINVPRPTSEKAQRNLTFFALQLLSVSDEMREGLMLVFADVLRQYLEWSCPDFTPDEIEQNLAGLLEQIRVHTSALEKSGSPGTYQ